MNVRFLNVKLKSTFDALKTKDSFALYWIEETKELFKGETLFGTGALATEKAAGLLSAEDYAALKVLVASGGGISNLKPVDGTISISDVDGGKAIGVSIAQKENNAIVAVEGGLFVPTTVVPEYSIEKQSEAESGYAVSYKLKKTVGEEVSYVGDAINIAKDMMLKSATLEIVASENVPYDGAVVGDPYIKMTFNDANTSNIYIPVKGLVDTYTAGAGIEIVDNKIGVKLAENAHGLMAVNGTLDIALATRKSDGAMSKEDKLKLDSIPSAYVAKKYEIAGIPIGTLVNYGDREIRVMCPANAEYTKQNVGAGGDANTYYMTLKTYAPNGGVVGYRERLGNQVDNETLTTFSVDEYGRKYQSTWLGLAKIDDVTGAWVYYGKNSSTEKFIGWDYQIDWYNADGIVVASDSVRINLSNEECHNSLRPYYGPNNDIIADVATIKETVESIEQSYTWTDM